jgi:hypothetical protein
MGPVSRLLEVLFQILDMDLPWRRLRLWLLGVLGASALLFPAAFGTALIRFSEARACAIVQPLATNFVLPTGRLEVVQHDGSCHVGFAKTEPTGRKAS